MIRQAVENDGYFLGSLFTEDEVDALLDMDEGWNEDLPTQLVEAAFERQSGLKVDLAVQGAAALNLVKADTNQAEFQQHNTVAVEKSEILARVYDTSDPDYHLVPKVTPEDPNRAVKSIDFAGGKAVATKLDLISLEANENPVEMALMDQLSVLQALKIFGANVDSLVAHVEMTWGIGYVQQLLNTVSLAPVADVSRYIATGGRPTPQLYLSANYSSAFRVISRVTAQLTELGFTSAFLARSAAIAKMVACTVVMVHGGMPLPAIRFNTNPAQFNTFSEMSLIGMTFESRVNARPSRLAASVSGKADYEVFLKSRQALKHIDANERRMAARDLYEIEKAVSVPASMSYSDAMKRLEIFDPQVSMRSKQQACEERSAPSRVTTMLFGFAHDISKPSEFLLGYEAIVCSLAMCTVATEAADLPKAYGMIVSIPGMKYLLDHINVERVREALAEVKELLKRQSDSRRTVAVYLLNRHRAFSKGHHATALSTYARWHATGRMPCSMEDSGGMVVAGYERPLRFVLTLLRSAYQMRPYIYMSRLHRTVNSAAFTVSVFDRRMSRNVADLHAFADWYGSYLAKKAEQKAADGVKTKRVYVPRIKVAAMLEAAESKVRTKVAVREFNVVFAQMRESWTGFYASIAKAHFGVLRLVSVMRPSIKASLTELLAKKVQQKAMEYPNLLVSGAVMEYLVNMARAAAYKMCKINFTCEMSGNSPSLDRYADMLGNLTEEEIESSFSVEMKPEYLDKGGKSHKLMMADVLAICKYAPYCDIPNVIATRVYKSAYNASLSRIRRSVHEMISRDMNMITVQANLEPDEMECKQEEEVIDLDKEAQALDAQEAVDSFDWESAFASEFVEKHTSPEWVRLVITQIASVTWAIEASAPLLHRNLDTIEAKIGENYHTVDSLKKRFQAVGALCDAAGDMDENEMVYYFTEGDLTEIGYLARCLGRDTEGSSIIN